MREIEFRGIRKDNGEIICGYLYQSTKESWITDSINIHLSTHRNFAWWQVVTESVGQYTGLKDKNGVKLFEGDIVEFYANYTNKPCGYKKGIVIITEYTLILKVGEIEYIASDETDEFPYHRCIVLGNIHQNPELLQ